MSVLKSVSRSSINNEFYSPIPKGYVKGKTKYMIVIGTVMSGLGKGIITSSLGLLLKNKGLKISPIKFDGYLNQDAGTLNPFRHGEVFVLDDGTECDMDLGTYERFLHTNLRKENYLTGGKVFNSILTKERAGKYLGRDVQFIPHVTGEIKLFVRNLAMEGADIVTIEVGGTVGDIENMYFIEAMRQLMYEEGRENVCFITLTYVLEPKFLGEQKSKAAQIGIRSLMSLGIQPDLIAIRSHNPVKESARQKISVYSNVPVDQVISVHDVRSIYEVPTLLKQSGFDSQVTRILGLDKKVNAEKEKNETKNWQSYEEKILNPKDKVVIGITGKYTTIKDSYASIVKALEHAGANLDCRVEIKMIETSEIEKGKITPEEALKDVNGIIVPGGFGKRGTEGKIKCIEYARINRIPFLGICYGMQMAVIEFARNVCGLNNANSTEIEPDTKDPVVCLLPEQRKIEGLGGSMRLGGRNIEVKAGTIAYKLYSSHNIIERFRHRYEVNPEYIKLLEKNGIIFSGKAPRVPIMQIMEIKDHPYFIGVQFHPCFTSRPLKPSPVFLGLIKAARQARS